MADRLWLAMLIVCAPSLCNASGSFWESGICRFARANPQFLAAPVAGCNDDMGPLHEAALKGDVGAVRAWIADKRDVDAVYDEPATSLEHNSTRTRGITALMVAARMGQADIVKLLVEAGANLYAESRWRDGSNPRNAFDYAVDGALETGSPGVVEYLWSQSDGSRFASRLGRHIARACSQMCDDKFGSEVRSNPALFLMSIARDDGLLGKGIGEAACLSGKPLRLLDFLARHKVRIPRNTLHCATHEPWVRGLRTPEERIAIASFFIDQGADLEDPGAGYTPLMGAAAAQDLEMVKFLLQRGANPNTRNAAGLTAIGVAANTCVFGAQESDAGARMKPQLAVIEYLVRSGADVKLYASASQRAQLPHLEKCCGRKPHSTTQQRICEMFGL